MAFEIERKFLVKGEFKHLALSSTYIVQGYLFADKSKSIRTLDRASSRRGMKHGSGGFGGHFRAVQGFEYIGDQELC